jgi:hypothetical protein
VRPCSSWVRQHMRCVPTGTLVHCSAGTTSVEMLRLEQFSTLFRLEHIFIMFRLEHLC